MTMNGYQYQSLLDPVNTIKRPSP